VTTYRLDAVEITTEILPGAPYGEPPTTQYLAFADGNRATWEAGRSEEEAMGKLVVSLDLLKRKPVAG
jgi:hypothetical protein